MHVCKYDIILLNKKFIIKIIDVNLKHKIEKEFTNMKKIIFLIFIIFAFSILLTINVY